VNSGKEVGEDLISFTPYHAWGADKGSKTCPICKYGWYHGVLYFVGNQPDWEDIRLWLQFLESESVKRDQFLKVYFVYGNEKEYSRENRTSEMEQLGRDLNLLHVALTFVPSFSDKSSDIFHNKINSEVTNTFLLYKRSNVIDKYINLKPTKENFLKISETLDNSINEYFELSRIKEENRN